MDQNTTGCLDYELLRNQAIKEHYLNDQSPKLLDITLALTEKFPDQCDGVIYYLLARSLDPLNAEKCRETYQIAFSKV